MKNIIVTGSVRCGSSLVMRMLELCGIPIIQDGHKQPDENNPHGYYECRSVYLLQNGRTECLQDSEGKAIKILPPTLLSHLPTSRQYKTIFLMRDPQEVANSFYRYMKVRSERSARPMVQTQEEFFSHFIPDHIYRINNAKEWVNNHPNFEILWIHHHDLISSPLAETTKICNHLLTDFPQYTFDPQGMAALVDPTLYRQRQSES